MLGTEQGPARWSGDGEQNCRHSRVTFWSLASREPAPYSSQAPTYSQSRGRTRCFGHLMLAELPATPRQLCSLWTAVPTYVSVHLDTTWVPDNNQCGLTFPIVFCSSVPNVWLSLTPLNICCSFESFLHSSSSWFVFHLSILSFPTCDISADHTLRSQTFPSYCRPTTPEKLQALLLL